MSRHSFFRHLGTGLVAVFLSASLMTGSVPAHAIKGGSLAGSTETGWAVALQIASTRDSGWMKCSGSLVTKDWVLTAKHCVNNANLQHAYASIGSHINYNWPYKITSIVAHPYLDVALVKLSAPGTATLPFSVQNLSFATACQFYGYGSDVDLKVTQLDSLGSPGDSYIYARSFSGNISQVGDSGGPLVKGGVLYGVLSAAVQAPREYLRPEDYKFVPSRAFAQWIFQTIRAVPWEGTPWITPAQPNPSGNPHQNQPQGLQPQPQPNSQSQQQPQPTPRTDPAPGRISGSDRVATSIAAWQQGGFTGTSLVIATGTASADALSAGPLAAVLGAPLVLSNCPVVEPATVAEIQARGIRDVRLVGGQVNFDPATLGTLQAHGVQVSRIYGTNRYGTAAAVAGQTLVEWNQRGKTQTPIFLADGVSFPDALSAGAGAAFAHGVVLLSAGAHLPPETVQFIQTHQAQSAYSIFPIGGPAVQAWNQAGITNFKAQPIQGLDRYQTAQFVAQAFAPGATSAVVASGVNFPDGLAGAALAAHRNACLLLTNPQVLPVPTATRLAQLPNRAASVVIGGPGAVSESVAWAIRG